jgi:hypothetical protein
LLVSECGTRVPRLQRCWSRVRPQADKRFWPIHTESSNPSPCAPPKASSKQLTATSSFSLPPHHRDTAGPHSSTFATKMQTTLSAESSKNDRNHFQNTPRGTATPSLASFATFGIRIYYRRISGVCDNPSKVGSITESCHSEDVEWPPNSGVVPTKNVGGRHPYCRHVEVLSLAYTMRGGHGFGSFLAFFS